MHRFSLASIVALVTLNFSGLAFGQNPAPGMQMVPVQNVTLDQALAGVRWQGRVPSPASIGDKTPVVMIYASWCPKCNAWSPELFAQIHEMIRDQPVVLFAINADETTRGVSYAVERNLVGPNIFHGDDPSIVQRMGFQSELFMYSVFKDGMQAGRSSAGSYFPKNDGTKEFSIVRDMKSGMGGSFSILTTDMSPRLREILWPAEIGAKLDERSLISLRKNMDESLADEFNSAVTDYLNRQIETIKTSREGTIPQQIKGYEIAEMVATDFKSTPQGRACRELVDKLEEDEVFQNELTAKKLYDQGKQKANSPVTLKRMMGRVISRYADTHYGQEAQKAIDAVQ
ncbi:hypothetical protein Pan97_25890 [Bremerella volcania]|uniref:Thioredoxin domain-containing protein n=1 Tax=Bremerella volcania TaxID=2527984 RepID=A0A518C8J7_9BACT|nr:protein disulfide isomerase family protein [Bremerella volcania]QDU75556.1 hypothetical protein Pan97_25890 [Bremerella volcania]